MNIVTGKQQEQRKKKTSAANSISIAQRSNEYLRYYEIITNKNVNTKAWAVFCMGNDEKMNKKKRIEVFKQKKRVQNDS